MKFKKVISAVCAIAAAAAIMPSAAAADQVEIRFRVGDSVLSINGKDVEVETPYVVGEGVTLVPVRVIMEAFGAEVGWDETTRTVAINKGEMEISLQIGSRTAVVNEAEIQLEEAPELTNGFTMVPLRFVSETLGADVLYDDATRAITVTTVALDAVAIKIGDCTLNKAELEFISNKTETEDVAELGEMCIFVEAAFNAEGLSFTDDEKADLLEYKNSTIDSMGGEEVYKEYLAENGITDGFIDRVVAWSSMEHMLFENDFSDEAIVKFYNDNYLRAKHILIFSTDDEGNPIDGSKELADSLFARAKSGEDFDALMAEYSEDPGSAAQPDGYYFTYGEMVPEFEETTLALGMGEIGMCESIYGYHIIKRLPLEKEVFDDYNLWNSVVDNIYTSKVSELRAKHGLTVEYNDAVIDLINN